MAELLEDEVLIELELLENDGCTELLEDDGRIEPELLEDVLAELLDDDGYTELEDNWLLDGAAEEDVEEWLLVSEVE